MRIGINVDDFGVHYVDYDNLGLKATRRYVDLPKEEIDCFVFFVMLDRTFRLCEHTVEKLNLKVTNDLDFNLSAGTLIKLLYDWLKEQYKPFLKQMYELGERGKTE